MKFTRGLNISPIGEDEHDPRVELRQRLRDEVLARLGEDGADEPQVERIGGETAGFNNRLNTKPYS